MWLQVQIWPTEEAVLIPGFITHLQCCPEELSGFLFFISSFDKWSLKIIEIPHFVEHLESKYIKSGRYSDHAGTLDRWHRALISAQ